MFVSMIIIIINKNIKFNIIYHSMHTSKSSS